MKKRLINAGILCAVFLVAVFVFEYITNRGNNNMTADIGRATLPTVSFSCEGHEVNYLNPYIQKMDVTTMRDSIAPVTGNGLEIHVKSYDAKIQSLDYSVYSLDGKEKLSQTVIKGKDIQETMTLNFDKSLLTEERLLTIVLQVDGKNIHYYTRIVDAAEFAIPECLEYIYNYHENAMGKVENVGVGAALEPSNDADNTTFQHVNIHSDYDHVSWGMLQPQVVGSERWKITETNSTYTSVLLEYEVSCKGEENETDFYTVKEFFRVRHVVDTMYLLDYDRTMEQIFNPNQQALSEKGILLGIAGPEVPYMVNKDGTKVAFIQADELWNYNREKDEMSLLFSFKTSEDKDIRNLVDDHEIKLLAIDKSGNVTFAVYGYMNRGAHEGEVGAAIYYYNTEKNSIEEKAFIPSDQAAAIATEELGKLVYYSVERDMLHVLIDGKLYEIDMKEGKKKVLVKGLEEGQYQTSQDGHLVAYQSNGSLEEATEVVVKNLETGKSYKVKAGEGESIRPLGFVNQDFVVGAARTADIGQTVSGQKVIPMYKVEIRNAKNKVVKTYQSDSDYVLSVEIQDGMLQLNRAVKSGNAYTQIAGDQITSNREKEESNIFLESYVTELKETQMRLTFADGISDTQAKVLKPKQVLFEKPSMVSFENDKNKTDQYYVYGLGKLQAVYTHAGDAVQKADEVDGVVVSSHQKYVWERGNRYLKYGLSGKEEVIASMQEKLRAGASPMDVVNELSGGNGLDLTGCVTEQMLYLVNKGVPVIGMIDGGNSVILTGYDETYVAYTETASGRQTAISYAQMDQLLAGSGRTFISYLE